MTERNPPSWLQGGSHPAEHDRLLMADIGRREGVIGDGALLVTERAAGANMSVDVAAGSALIAGDESAHQGVYHAYNDATVNLTVAASDASNPRKDIVVARVRDAFYSGTTDAWALEVITGTPATSPSEPALPDNALKLATIDVAAGSTSVTNANITDRRQVAAFAGDIGAVVVFNASGTFAKADFPWARRVRARLIGGGGGGGGGGTTSTGQISFGDGGGAGGYSEKVYDVEDLAASETVTIGAGGTGGGGGVSGNGGGNSSFGTQTANGGGGGGVRPPTTTIPHTSSQSPSSRIGGNASGGDTNQRGGPGGWGGGWGTSALQVKGGDGGSSALAGGPPSASGGNNGTDADVNTGAGGTGAANGQSSGGLAGGDGASGIVILELYA